MSNAHSLTLIDGMSVESASPVLIVDGAQRLVGLNDPARDLAGVPAGKSVLGLPCYEIMHGRELDGSPLCVPGCAPMRRILSGEAPGPCKMLLPQCKAGDVKEDAPGRHPVWIPYEWQHAAIRADDSRNGLRVMHVGRDLQRMDALMQFSEQVLSATLALVTERGARESNPLRGLTPQERRILRMLCDGQDTPAIADALGVSRTTTRNHIQHILQKLGCHSRLEAVALAQPFVAANSIQTAERTLDLLDI